MKVQMRNYQCCHLTLLIACNELGFCFYKSMKLRNDFQLGSVAGPVIQATGRLESEDGLRTGVLVQISSC